MLLDFHIYHNATIYLYCYYHRHFIPICFVQVQIFNTIFAHFWLVLYNRVYPIRGMIFYDYVRDLNASQADFQLNSVFGYHAPSITTVLNFGGKNHIVWWRSYWTSGTVFTPENPTRMKNTKPYSSDLATCDFSVFPKVNTRSIGWHLVVPRLRWALSNRRFWTFIKKYTKNAFKTSFGGWNFV